MLPRQSLADGRDLTQLFLVELRPQVGDGNGMLVLLELAGLPLLLEPLAELAQLMREQRVRSPDMDKHGHWTLDIGHCSWTS